jgi:hypothetical protein
MSASSSAVEAQARHAMSAMAAALREAWGAERA